VGVEAASRSVQGIPVEETTERGQAERERLGGFGGLVKQRTGKGALVGRRVTVGFGSTTS